MFNNDLLYESFTYIIYYIIPKGAYLPNCLYYFYFLFIYSEANSLLQKHFRLKFNT